MIFSLLLFLAIVLVIDYNAIENEQKMAEENISQRLMLGALKVYDILPEQFHHKEMHSQPISDQEHLRITLALAELAKKLQLRYVYSLILNNGDTYFSSGSAINEAVFANKKTPVPLLNYLDIYSDAPSELKAIYRDNQPLFVENQDTNEPFKSVFIPRTAADGTRYILAADIAKSYISDIKNHIAWSNTLLFAPLIIFFAAFTGLTTSQVSTLQKNITARTHELKQAFTIDKLTGLPNRVQLLEAQKARDYSSLALVNIDRFNEVNEIYGTYCGDQIIHLAAQEVMQWASDKPVEIYKTHSDEFAILITKATKDLNLSDKTLTENIFSHWIIELLERLRVKLFLVDKQNIQITASAGIVVNSQNPNTEADRALRKAKKELSEYYIYNETLSTEDNYLNNRKMLEMIKTAIASNNIKTYFQPILNVHNQQINKYEALIRMHSAEGEVISPFFFIGIARKSKLYPALTQIMFDHVLEILIRREDLTLSVNISFDDIANKDTRLYIIQQLLTCKPKGKLVFELLESDEIDNFKLIEDFMVKLSRLNVDFSIDDFGSGFSNYSRLSKLPIRYLKIDGSLIKGMLENEKHQIIVQSIIDSAHQLGYLTIAEFVENAALAEALTEMKVDYLQGYYISKPEPLHFD
ncbi:MAG: bifunctional diguanylate cyclase/phosphodiesterase [Gammaproteobacteria bacterium]|nr:bifunctional diguanylate cyclase/phosphodiesterase [Gammaproteobacteria bacterium]